MPGHKACHVPVEDLTHALRRTSKPGCFPLRDLRRTLEAQRKLSGGLDSPYVFCHLAGVRVGKRFSYSGFYKAWLRAVRAAGVARVHDFRRTAIRNLERDGVPRSVAMAMVGQKTEEVYRRYAIVDEAMIREAAVKIDRGAKVRQTTAQRTAQSNRPLVDR
jgi:Phage integrase family